MPKKKNKGKARGRFKSDFERKIYESVFRRGGACDYESIELPFIRKSVYKPDFVLHNGIIVEAKGRFTSQDRSKHLLVKKQYPKLDIRFVFLSNRRINKGSDTRYMDWCEKHGYECSMNYIPREWLLEKPGDSARELEKWFGYEFDWTGT